MVSYQEIELTRINMTVNFNATTVSYNSYKFNAQSEQNIKQDSK
jgi:hypothetical protein